MPVSRKNKVDKGQQLMLICDRLVGSSHNATKAVSRIKSTSSGLTESARSQLELAETLLENAREIDVSLQNSVVRVEQTNDELAVQLESIIDKAIELGKVREQFDKLQEVTMLIDSLAARSHILALNALIEAARLGDQGQAFAVVANQVKQLASSSRAAAQDIKELVQTSSETVSTKLDENIALARLGFTNIEASKAAVVELKSVYGEEGDDVRGDNIAGEGKATIRKLIQDFSSITASSKEVDDYTLVLQAATGELNGEVETTNAIVSDLIGIVKGSPIVNLDVKTAFRNIRRFDIIDVRRNEEFNDELGHIRSATLRTIDDVFESKIQGLDRKKTYLFVCRSGGRSARAARVAQAIGFVKVFNMEGGMLAWNEASLPSD